MKVRLIHFWENIKTSFWFIPCLMIFFAIILSIITVFLDRNLNIKFVDYFGLVYSGGIEGSRIILSTIAGSMITVAGVVFSITIAALALASSQFGPRLLRNFMNDKGNQIVLGIFIATFIYCLLTLRAFYRVDIQDFTPIISTTFSIMLAIVNVIIITYFIHHISVTINADSVIYSVYQELTSNIEKLYFNSSSDKLQEKFDSLEIFNESIEDKTYTVEINSLKEGYLQAIDWNNLIRLSKENNYLLNIKYRIGEFIVLGDIVYTIKASSKDINENTKLSIFNCFIIGSQRTPLEDIEFSINQLVEVALRALSPGINDPFTAITCIDYLGSAICRIINKEPPSTYIYDEDGALRIVAKRETFEGIVNASFDQIRQYGKDSISVTIRLLEVLGKIANLVEKDIQRDVVLKHANKILHSSELNITEKNDLDDVKDRYSRIFNSLNKFTP